MTIKYFNGGYFNDATAYYNYDADQMGVGRHIGYEDNPPPSYKGVCPHPFTRAIHEPGIKKRAAEMDKGWEYNAGRFFPPSNRPSSAPLHVWPEWHVVIHSLFAEYYGDELKDKAKYNPQSNIVSVDDADPHLILPDLEYVLGVKVAWVDLEATREARAKWFAAEKARQEKWAATHRVDDEGEIVKVDAGEIALDDDAEHVLDPEPY